jgi:GTPase involved in cell partitioning and DNA repair
MPNGNDPAKWPLSITDREFGALEQELKELRHDFRNLKQIVVMSGISIVTLEDMNDLKEGISRAKYFRDTLKIFEEKHQQLNDEMMKLKLKVYTGASIGMVVAGIIMWLVDVAFKTMDQMH